MTKHSKRSPSGAKRWGTCTACIDFEEYLLQRKKIFPQQQDSTGAAALGTAVHSLIEKCILRGLDPDDFEGKKIGQFFVDLEMIRGADIFTTYVRTKQQEYELQGNKVVLIPEQTFDLSFLGIEDCEQGTADCVLISDCGAFHVIDYKNGRNYVSEVDNWQLKLYARAAIEYICQNNLAYIEDITEIHLTIVQPNCPGSEPIRSEVIPTEKLLDWTDDFIERLEEPKQFVAGDHCDYCPCAGFCEAQAKHAAEIACADFDEPCESDDIDFSGVEIPEDIAVNVITYEKFLMNFIAECKKRIHTLMIEGQATDYMKDHFELVYSRKNTTLVKGAENILGLYVDDEFIYAEPKLKPLTDLKRVCKKQLTKDEYEEVLSDITFKPQGDIIRL